MDTALQKTIEAAQHIVIIQADNPDGDSLASSLALEQILSDMGKQVSMYCGVAIPSYLRYLNGWDRVQDVLPHNFDTSIIVDTSALSLLEQLEKTGSLPWLKTKPCVVLDHHTTDATIDFASILYIKPAVATGELIYDLSKKLDWPRNSVANNMLMTSILSDSLGLMSEGTTPSSLRIVADLVEQGVSIAALEETRRATQKKSPELLSYKAKLLQRIEYSDDQRIATIHIPWDEIEKYSPEYNPSMLVIDEMRFVKKVALAIAFKSYPDGRITAKLRANVGFGIAAQVAEGFGGGGHKYAAGFKIADGRPYNEVKSECIRRATQLLDTLNKDTNHETTQYAYTVG